MLIIAFYLGGAGYYLRFFGIDNDIKNLINHFSFVNLIDLRYRNSLIGVEWIIPIIMFYYALIPTIYLAARKSIVIIALLLPISFVVSIYYSFNPPSYYVSIDQTFISLWSVEMYLFSFVAGIFTFFVYMKIKKSTYKFEANYITLSLHILLLFVWIFTKTPIPELFIAIWTCTLIIICSSKNNFTRLVFENKIILYIGTISYSIYLTHLVILRFFEEMSLPYAFVIGLMLTVAVSTLTYKIVERPFMGLITNFNKK